jgi:hypothetical protein
MVTWAGCRAGEELLLSSAAHHQIKYCQNLKSFPDIENKQDKTQNARP